MSSDAKRYLILAPVVVCSSLALLTHLPVVGGMGVAAWIAKQSGALGPNLVSDVIPIGWAGACSRLFGTSSEPTRSLFDEMKTTYLRAIEELPGKVSPNQPKPPKVLLGVTLGSDTVANPAIQDELAFYEALKANATIAFDAASRPQSISTLLTELERGPAVAIEAVHSLIDDAAAPYPGLNAKFVPLVKERFPSLLQDTFRSQMRTEGADGTRIWRTFVEAVFASFNEELRKSRELNQQQVASLSRIEAKLNDLQSLDSNHVVQVLDEIDRLYAVFGDELDRRLVAQTEDIESRIEQSAAETIHHTTHAVEATAQKIREDIGALSDKMIQLTESELAKHASISPSPKRHIQNLPHAPSHFFVGRKDDLEKLHNYFEARDGSNVLIQSIQGLGGIGKTQLAVHYSHAYAPEYDGIWWLRSESYITLAADYIELGRAIDVDIDPTDIQVQVVDRVRRSIENLTTSGERWLLVFDNAHPRDPEWSLLPFIPKVGNTDVLITSRIKEWTHVAIPLDLGVLAPSAAVGFLLERAQSEDAASAQVLAAELGYFPLALEQAGAFIVAQMGQETFATYLTRFRSDPLQRLQSDTPRIGDYHDVVATTWFISFSELEKLEPTTKDFLDTISFFASDDIPIELLVKHCDLLEPSLSIVLRDPDRVSEIIGHLLRYSLMEVGTKSEINIHRLVQTVIREWLPSSEVTEQALRVAAILRRELEIVVNSSQGAESIEAIAPHVHSLAVIARHFEIIDRILWRLVSDTAILLGERAEYREAILLMEMAIATSEGLQSQERAEQSTGFHHLARFNRDLGEFEVALDLANQALAITSSDRSVDPKSLAIDLQLRANILRELGRFPEVEDDLKRALAVYEQIDDKQSDAMGSLLNDLGVYYRATGRLDASMEVLERAISIHRQIHPGDHREIANDLGNLADTSLSRGELDKAEEYLNTSVAMLRRFVHQDHPRIAHSFNVLGRIQLAKGEVDRAELSFEAAIELGNRHLDESHPILTSARGGLVRVLHKRGHFREAALLADSILGTRERLLGRRDTQRPALLSSLSVIFCDQGDLPRARRLAESALEEFGKIHLSEHPLTATLLSNLGAVQFAQGELLGAESTLERAYSFAQSMNGLTILDGAMTLNNLGSVKDSLGKTDEAVDILELALSIQNDRLPADHPDLVPTLSNLGLARCHQKQWESGIQLMEESLAVAHRSGLRNERIVQTAKRSLAEILESFSDELHESGRVSESMSAARRSLHLYRELVDSAGEGRNLHRLRLRQEELRGR